VRAYLLVLGERSGLAWVLENERMAFTAERAKVAEGLEPGDELFIYTSRGCFGNPTRDRGRVVGTARVSGAPRKRRKALRLAGRDFTQEVDIKLTSLVPRRQDGVELAGLVPRLESFPNKTAWAATLRRPLVELAAEDASLLRQRLRPVASEASREVRQRYIEAARPSRARA